MTRNAMSLVLLGVVVLAVLVLMFADFSAEPGPVSKNVTLNGGE